MIEALLLGGALVAGVDGRLVVLLGAALWAPVPAAGVFVAIGAVARAGTPGGDGSLRFVESVVGELRAGSSVRAALLVACGDRPECRQVRRRLAVGEPLAACAAGLGAGVGGVGDLVEAAVTAAGEGGRMLPAFEEILVHASAQQWAAVELRTATAQVRASMSILVGAPALYLAWSLASGRLADLLAHPGGAEVAALGASLFTSGMAVMVLLARGRRW